MVVLVACKKDGRMDLITAAGRLVRVLQQAHSIYFYDIFVYIAVRTSMMIEYCVFLTDELSIYPSIYNLSMEKIHTDGVGDAV